MTTRYKPWLCWSCGYLCDAASIARRGHDPKPKPGDFAVCLNCGAASTFSRGTWRQLTEQDLFGLDAESRDTLRRAQLTQAACKAAGLIPDLTKGGGRA